MKNGVGFAGLLIGLMAGFAHADKTPPYHPAPSQYQTAKKVELDLRNNAHVVVVPINETIELGIAAFVRRVLHQNRKADLIVLDINTLGGRVDAAIEIRDALLNNKAPTVAYVHPRAISAGALIALACDVIVMAPGGSIGAATPIQSDGQSAQPVEEKMVSYMRTEMRTTAEAKQRRGDIAEAMVDAEVEIEGIDQAGKLLTLDTERALTLHMAELEAASLTALLAKLSVHKAKITYTRINWAEKIARVLTGPVVSSLLMSIGMLALLIGLYTQNFGIPFVIALMALTAFFTGHLVVNLAGWEELLLFTAGLVMLGVEVIALPGFGVVGVLGLLGILASFVMAMIGMKLDLSVNSGALGNALMRVFMSLGLAVASSALLMRWFPKTAFGRQLVLAHAETKQAGFVSMADAPRALVGQQGTAFSALRPAGKATFNGQRYDVVSESGYVDPAEPIHVVRTEGSKIVVRKL